MAPTCLRLLENTALQQGCMWQSWRSLSSVQFSHSVVSDSLWPHGLQHAWPPCTSLTPRACSNSCPSSQWCHPTISSSVVPFSHLQSFPASGSFPVSQFFTSGGQVQFSSVAQSHPTLFNPMDCSTPGLPVHHQPPEITQTHLHWVNDAIQPSPL